MKLSSLAGLLHSLQKGSAPLFRTSPHLMKKKAMCVCIVLLLVCSTLLCSCSVSKRVLARYYSEKSNYVTASGVVSHIKDAPERDHLVFGFSELSPSMADVSFNFDGQFHDCAALLRRWLYHADCRNIGGRRGAAVV